MKRLLLFLWALFAISRIGALVPISTVNAREIQPPGIATPAVATPIMKLDDVRIGMKGYGLTVFHGDKIEPFAVEVISVQRDFAPGKGVVWIRCPDPRMQQSGPVQGMSGSPIYLWEPNDAKAGQLGEGGRLIGAFAFGFMATKDCYVGVQPIEQMLQVGEHARDQMNRQEQERAQLVDAEAPQTPAAGGDGQTMRQSLRTVLEQAQGQDIPSRGAWRARLIARTILGKGLADEQATSTAAPPQPPDIAGQPLRLMLPLSVSTPGLAQLMAPLAQQAGLLPFQAPMGAQAGRPPTEINAQDIRLAPGSILSIPLAYGDLDLAAVGTVTDVLPDGRVLAFGHAMFGQGPLAVPMASGYVHYIVPGLITSFKLAGSGVIRGTVVRDETSGIVGAPITDFTTAKARLRITHPNQQPRDYQYDLVKFKPLLPMVTAIVAIESLGAQQALPVENTVRIRGSMKFAGNRELKIDSIVPGMEPRSLYYELLPPIMILAQNEHESVLLESMNLAIEVQDSLRLASMTEGRLDRAQVAPGQPVGINVTLNPYGGEPMVKRIKFDIPAHLPDGEYNLIVCDAATYAQTLLTSRPHLMQTRGVDDIMSILKQISEVPNDALFVMMALPEAGLALGHQEMPKLPSSVRTMIASPTSATTNAYVTYATKTVKLDTIPSGQLDFTVTVRRELAPAK